MKTFKIIFLLLWMSILTNAQSLRFMKTSDLKPLLLEEEMSALALSYLAYEEEVNQLEAEDILWKFYVLSGRYQEAIEGIIENRASSDLVSGHPVNVQYELFCRAKIKQAEEAVSFEDAYRSVFSSYLGNCDDISASNCIVRFTTYDAVEQFTRDFKTLYSQTAEGQISLESAKELLSAYFLFHIYSKTEPIIYEVSAKDEERRYLIGEELIISPLDGAELSVITVRKRNTEKLPAVLIFTIYAEPTNKNQAMLAASKGYIGVIANSRGKRKSTDPVEPYKHEHKDVNVILDWIIDQDWSDTTVGMYGGSYNGFSQWAALKNGVHPALKTIVPCVSAAPGIDVPMENNVFHNFVYKWIPYVTNNRLLDVGAANDVDRWDRMQKTWFESGVPYSLMDSIDGRSNALFQEWISHPSYDSYWQSMIPYKNEFAHIDIPVLSITGYYDDGQPGAMYYYREHLKYRKDADHVLLVGPYDHWGAQGIPQVNLRGYEIDTVARINIREELIFDWFDHILKGAERPPVLKDQVNIQLMGQNKWLHVADLAEISADTMTLYLSSYPASGHYALQEDMVSDSEPVKLELDMAERSIYANSDYYPWPIVRDDLKTETALVFGTKIFDEDIQFSGSLSGTFKVKTNKKDFDLALSLYELTEKGKYIHLTYHIGRASYAKSNEQRSLLIPGKFNSIEFGHTRMISKRIAKGSRLVLLVNVNKNPFSQVNYGTGKDVSKESSADGLIPLILEFSPESKIHIPLLEIAGS